MDTSAGPIPGFDPSLMDIGVRRRAQRGQAGAQGAARLRERARDAGVQARARGAARLSRVRGRASGPTCRRSCGATIARELAYQRDDLRGDAPQLALPGAHHRRSNRTSPFVSRVAARWPTRSRVRRWSSIPTPGIRPSSRTPTAWIEALTRFPRVALPRRRAVAGSGGARRPARGRGAAAPRRRHDVHVVGRAPVRALRRRGAERRLAARRRASRADRGVRGRRVGRR